MIFTDYRHEWKHPISYGDLLILRQRLGAVMQPDPNAVGGKYFIRSLYFDTPTDTALRQKLDGVNRREKFRIRYYNHDTSLIHLEKKSKLAGLGNKQSAPLTAHPKAPGAAGGVKLHGVEPKTAAMLMAIVAEKVGKPLNELRFISIKEVE